MKGFQNEDSSGQKQGGLTEAWGLEGKVGLDLVFGVIPIDE